MHQEGSEEPNATTRIHRGTMNGIIEDTLAHDGVQETKTEDTFSFNDSGTAQKVDIFW